MDVFEFLGEVARALADQNLRDGLERVARSSKMVEMGRVPYLALRAFAARL
jgi:hypothetical protein